MSVRRSLGEVGHQTTHTLRLAGQILNIKINNMGIAMLLGSVLSSSIYSVFSKKFHSQEKKTDPIAFLQYMLFLVSIISIFVYLFFSFDIRDIHVFFDSIVIIFVLVECLLVSVVATIFHLLLKKTPLSEISILMSLSGFVTLIVSSFLGISSIGLYSVIGGIFVLFGTIVVSYNNDRWKFGKSLLFLIISMFSSAIAAIIDNKLILEYGVNPMLWVSISYLLPGVFISLVFPKSFKRIPQMIKDGDNTILSFIAAMSSFISYYFIYSAYNYGIEAYQSNFILSSQTIIVTVLSIIWLKEKNAVIKVIIASVLCSIGIFLISF